MGQGLAALYTFIAFLGGVYAGFLSIFALFQGDQLGLVGLACVAGAGVLAVVAFWWPNRTWLGAVALLHAAAALVFWLHLPGRVAAVATLLALASLTRLAGGRPQASRTPQS